MDDGLGKGKARGIEASYSGHVSGDRGNKVSEGGYKEESEYNRKGNPKQTIPQISQLSHRVNPAVESTHYSERGIVSLVQSQSKFLFEEL